MNIIKGLLLGLLAAGAMTFAGCTDGEAGASGANGQGGGGGAGRAGQGAVVPVTTATVVKKSMPVEIRVIGAAEPYSSVAIRAQITGQLIDVNFKEGDDVKKGQVLFSLDLGPHRIQHA